LNHKPNSAEWYEFMRTGSVNEPVIVRSYQGQYTVEYIVEGFDEDQVNAEAEKLARNYYGYGCMMGQARQKKIENNTLVWQATGHRGTSCD